MTSLSFALKLWVLVVVTKPSPPLGFFIWGLIAIPLLATLQYPELQIATYRQS